MIVPDRPQETMFDRMRATGRVHDPFSLAEGQPAELSADVVVVGTGAGGSAVFRELALAGVDVLALEAGHLHLPHAEFNQREEDMLQQLFFAAGARVNDDLSVTITHGRGVGGGTVHNICLSENTPEAILGRWSEEAGIEGWSATELAPVFERIRRNLRVTPIHAGEVNENNDIVRRGTEALGWSGRVYDHSRFACLKCGYCVLGCAYNRKQSALITYVPSGIEAGGRLAYGCRVDGIRTSDGRATGLDVTLVDPLGRRRLGNLEVRANTVVLAASSVMTPAILQRSEIEDPAGITGNRLRLHPAVVVAGRFERRIEGWKGLPQSYVVDEHADFYEDGYGGFLIIPLFGHPGTSAAMIPGMGPELGDWMRRYPYMSAATPLLHDETRGRIRAEGDRVAFDYELSPDDEREMKRGIRETARMYLAAGATEVLLPYKRRQTVIRTEKELEAAVAGRGAGNSQVTLSSVHPQGAVPMGATPELGAVNPQGRHWTVPNLWVADGSLFPSSVGVPPQLSIYAAGTRVAREILRERSAGDG